MTQSFKYVIDTNIIIKQFIEDPLTEKVNQLFQHLGTPHTRFFVPDLIYIYVESANVLRKYARAKLYTTDQILLGLAKIKELPFEVMPTKQLVTKSVQIGLKYEITAYDGCYVALSHQANAPLLTLDKRLVNSLTNSPFDIRLFTDFSIPPLPSSEE